MMDSSRGGGGGGGGARGAGKKEEQEEEVVEMLHLKERRGVGGGEQGKGSPVGGGLDDVGNNKDKDKDKDKATRRKIQVKYGSATWPDPLAEQHDRAKVDDISRMNSTCVERVLQPRTAEDIKAALSVAVKEGRQVSVRGTQVCVHVFCC